MPGERLRLEAYRAIASAADEAALEAVRAELADRFGPPPGPVDNLLAVAQFRMLARQYGVTEVSAQGSVVRFSPLVLRESQEMRMQRLYPRSVYKTTVSTISVPRPAAPTVGTGPAGRAGAVLRDVPLLEWCRDVLAGVVGPAVAAAS